jgi:flagellar basal-body rod modification protein FlgD
MSAITNSLLPNSASQGSTVNNPNGFQSLTPSDFVQMMVTQLENQDPLNPTNSQDILSQISEIGQLQSSTTLQTSLTGMTLQNQIGAASAMIGKQVTGTDANNNNQTGTVTGVTITQVPAAQSSTGAATTNVNLNLNTGAVLPLSNISSIAPGPTVAATTGSSMANAAATGATLNTPAVTPTTQPSGTSS